jgi:hypothetical protein
MIPSRTNSPPAEMIVKKNVDIQNIRHFVFGTDLITGYIRYVVVNPITIGSRPQVFLTILDNIFETFCSLTYIFYANDGRSVNLRVVTSVIVLGLTLSRGISGSPFRLT